MTTLRTSALALAATAAVGFSSFAVAPTAEAASCSANTRNVYCSMAHAKKIQGKVAYGQRSAGTKKLQIALTNVGFRVPATGYFGPQTRAQLRAYQHSRKIAVTGTFNSSTAHALRVGAGAKRAKAAKRPVRAAVTSTAVTGSRAQAAVSFAHAQIGKPYRYGATGPSSYDCSGLTGAAWRAAGKSIPRTSHAQLRGLKKVSRSSLRPGDIVGFYGGGHVGIYVGNGYVIHAPRTGQNVKKVRLNSMSYAGAVRP